MSCGKKKQLQICPLFMSIPLSQEHESKGGVCVSFLQHRNLSSSGHSFLCVLFTIHLGNKVGNRIKIHMNCSSPVKSCWNMI